MGKTCLPRPRRVAGIHGGARRGGSPITSLHNLTIRRAGADDGEALVRLAGLDSKRVPAGDFLIAEVDGDRCAAVAIESGEVVADPFRQTAHIVGLLRLRAERIRELDHPELVRVRGLTRMKAGAVRLLPRRRRAPAESRP